MVTGWLTLPVCYLGPQIKCCGPWQYDWVENQFTKRENLIFSALEIPKFQCWGCRDCRIRAQAATDRTLSSTLTEQPWPALRRETARQFAAEGLIYWGYKSHMPSVSQAQLSSALLLVHIRSLYALGQAAGLPGGTEPAPPSPCGFGPEMPTQKFLNGSGYPQTLKTAFIYKAACWKLVSRL